MEIIQFVADALGDASYLVVSDGEAAVVDPQRDVRPYMAAAAERGARIAYAFETHVHNDYLSGGPELAARGATVVAPAQARLELPHRGVADGEEIAVGRVRLRAVATPGHTHEHTAYVVVDEDGRVRGAFTGGALLMAAAGRTDLLGPAHTEPLTRMQWESAQRIAGLLPADGEILPTHGAGSFCSTAVVGSERRATLAAERGRNPALLTSDYEAFRERHLAHLPPVPGYYRHMAPINRAGARVYRQPPVPAGLAPAAVGALAAEGVQIVDVRRRFDFVRGHVPGSVVIEEDGSMLAYFGWLIPFNAPLVLVTYGEAQAERVTVELFRIGYEDVRGYVPFADWAADRPVDALDTLEVEEARAVVEGGARPVLDVRFEDEHLTSPLPGVFPRPIDGLPTWADEVGDEPVLLICRTGHRATMAASFLRARGRRVSCLIEGGAADLQPPAGVSA